MGALKLEAGQVYSLKVVDIRSRQKQVKKKDTLMYHVFAVKLEDKLGNTCDAEYLTRTPEKGIFYCGVFQYIRCGIVGTVGIPEIEPAEEPMPGLNPRYTPPVASIVSEMKEKQAEGEVNNFAIPISGRSITFAMAYAKDLIIAEISMQPVGYRVTEEDIDKMFSFADKINNNIIERVTF